MAYGSRYRYMFAALFLAIVLSFDNSTQIYADSSVQLANEKACLEILKIDSRRPNRTKKAIFDAYRSFSAFRSIDESQIILKPAKDNGGIRHVYIEDIKNTSAILDKTIWTIDSNKYELIDVGHLQLNKQSQMISRATLEHLLRHPNETLIIHLGRDTVLATNTLKTLRWVVHDSVLAKYKERKPYLSADDFQLLENINRQSGNSEVLGVLNYDDSALVDITEDKLVDRLLATIQITYFGDRNYLFPNLRSLYEANGLEVSDEGDKFPFEYRLDEDKIREFRSKFYKRFEAKTTCEFTRYAKFENLPDQVQSRLLHEALRRAKNRGIKTIVASSDDGTKRLFQRYGFQLYPEELPIKNSVANEHLLFLEVDSFQFQEVYNRLEMTSNGLKLGSSYEE